MIDQNYIDILISTFKLRDGVISKDLVSELYTKKRRYEISHPELEEELNKKEALKQYREENIKEYFKELEKFNGDVDKIPEIPSLPVDFLKVYVWPYLINAGAIPKKDLIKGKEYKGSCRNSSKATWDGEYFWYPRDKFGYKYQEKINHFQDDDGYDVFIPIEDRKKEGH